MGCAQSRIENEEAVARCKERKQFMRAAVAARAAFAASHAAYALALRNAGAALGDFPQADPATAHPHPHHSPSPSRPSASAPSAAASSAADPAIQPPTDTILPPPPPHPDFSPFPLHRSVSMPEIPKSFPSKLPAAGSTATISEEEDELEVAESSSPTTPPPTRPQPPASPTPSPSPSPAPAPSPSPAPVAPPPPPPPQSTPWDYFFSQDENLPELSLNEPPEIHEEKEQIVEEEVKKRAAANAPTAADRDFVVDAKPPAKKVVVEPPPAPVKKPKQGGEAPVHHQHAASTGSLETKRDKIVQAAASSRITVLQVLNQLDEHFIKAAESGREVSKMLEANRMHYHSNFADSRGYIDSARVMKVITWNKPTKGLPNGDDEKDVFDNDEWETHATVLDKILAWEKKLYEEVKACELMKTEYKRKVALLSKQKKHGANPETIERTKAAVSHLHTRYVVDMQSLETTVSEIQHLRDNKLYPKLLGLVDGLDKMWETMHTHHDSQLKIVSNLRGVDLSNAPKELSEHNHEQTDQLWRAVMEWHSQFQKLMSDEKEYIHSAKSWLKLNLVPIESGLKEVSSPSMVHKPPIQALLYAWHDYLEKLPEDLAKSAISSFAAVINTIMVLQQDELKQKEKCEETQKEYTRKVRAFEDWCHKYSQRMGPSREVNVESGEGNPDPVAEKKSAVEALKSKLDSEIEAHQKLCKQLREKSLGSLKTHLPELFRAMSDFSLASAEMYKKLKSISQMQNSTAD